MSEYKNKHLISQGAPDGFDLDRCPVYQAYLKKCEEDSLKEQMRNELQEDVNVYYQAVK